MGSRVIRVAIDRVRANLFPGGGKAQVDDTCFRNLQIAQAKRLSFVLNYIAVHPPSIVSSEPVINSASSEQI